MLSRIQLFEKIRRDRRLEPDVSQRELGRRYNVHRRTVRAALESAIPPPRAHHRDRHPVVPAGAVPRPRGERVRKSASATRGSQSLLNLV